MGTYKFFFFYKKSNFINVNKLKIICFMNINEKFLNFLALFASFILCMNLSVVQTEFQPKK